MRILLTRRWLLLLLIAVLASAGMVFLGRWQYGRYEVRSQANDRIDASTVTEPAPLGQVLTSPAGPAASAVPEHAAWTRVEATGRYDADHEFLIRNRTAAGKVGYEVVTPLMLDDGAAVLVDRGWIPPSPDGPTAAPQVPAPPSGDVTIVGRIHLTESGGEPPQLRNGRWEARRVGVTQLGANLPYPIFGAYVLADSDTPGATEMVIEVGHENDWLNFGYAVQWWIFAAGALIGVAWLARRDVRSANQQQLDDSPDDSATGGQGVNEPITAAKGTTPQR